MKKLLFLSAVIFVFSCRGSKDLSTVIITSNEDVIMMSEEKIIESSAETFAEEIMEKEKWSCTNSSSYIPYDKDSVFFDTRIIRVNFHVMDRSLKDQNFREGTGEAEEYLPKLLENANKRLRKNFKMNLPAGNNTPQLNPRYQYRLVGNEPGDDGIYYHYDDDLYYFLNHGRKKNNYKKEVIFKYAVNSENVINIFLMPHHPDSVKSKTYKESNSGIALGTDLKLGANWGSKRERFWKYATLLNHEIGHVMNLRHSWIRNDGCDDTPEHKRNWQPGSKYPDGLTTNNVMDYNASQMAFSPCQLGRVHQVISTKGSKQRSLVVPDWCDFDPNTEIVIDREVSFTGEKDFNKDIIIEEGGKLIINCRLSMAKSSRIVVRPGGYLELNNCYLHNDCGDEWLGIEVQKQKKKVGQVRYSGEVIIENVKAISKTKPKS